MQLQKNCHKHVWVLSGTGEGPLIAKTFLDKGWKVTVSVVSSHAALQYSHLPLESIFWGRLEGVNGIRNFLEQHKGFDCVVDATHPFAQVITSDLGKACKQFVQPLIRFERPITQSQGAILIHSLKDLAKEDLQGQRIMLAIGSRHLAEAYKLVQKSGAKVFARVLPTPDSYRNALAASIPQDHLAVLKPLSSESCGIVEHALCMRWSITGVVCRQSGGYTQKSWQDITKKEKIRLWLISRPIIYKSFSNVVDSFDELFELVPKICN